MATATQEPKAEVNATHPTSLEDLEALATERQNDYLNRVCARQGSEA